MDQEGHGGGSGPDGFYYGQANLPSHALRGPAIENEEQLQHYPPHFEQPYSPENNNYPAGFSYSPDAYPPGALAGHYPYDLDAAVRSPQPTPSSISSSLSPLADSTQYVYPGGYTMDPAKIPAEFTRVPSGASVIDYNAIWEMNGRSYHGYKPGKYLLPNDGAEQDRLDMQHASFRSLLKGRLSLAPVVSPKRVMDVATGTGIWAIEFAQENPGSQVVGTDLSAIQPSNKPPNCDFIVEDSEEEWVGNENQPFDYVHMRFVATCFDDTKVVLRHAFNNMSPGGWIELQSPDFMVQSLDNNLDGTPLLRWFELVRAGLAQIGRDVHIARNYKQWLTELGFVDIQEKVIKWPANPFSQDPWLHEVGLFQMINFCDGARGIGWKLLEMAGLSAAEIDELTNDAKTTIKNTRYRCYLPTYVVYGRKPFAWEAEGWLPNVE